MLLQLDPELHSTMSEGWKDQFQGWVEKELGLFVIDIAFFECIPEAQVAFADVYLRKDGKFYISPFFPDEAAQDRFVIFYERRPMRLFFYTWQQAMIARQGSQGA